MASPRVSIERGTSHSLVLCECGWRELVFTEAGLQAAVHQHKSLAHGDNHGAADFVATRRWRTR